MAKPMYGRSLMLIVIRNFGGIFGEFRTIHALGYVENISSVQGNIILCEILKTNLCGKPSRNNNCVTQSRFRG